METAESVLSIAFYSLVGLLLGYFLTKLGWDLAKRENVDEQRLIDLERLNKKGEKVKIKAERVPGAKPGWAASRGSKRRAKS